MTKEQREEALGFRQRHRLPWHSPPHYVGESCLYLVSAACYQHHPVIGISPQRMGAFESDLLDTLRPLVKQVFTWIVLPNHYHVVVHAPDIRGLLKSLGQLHGPTSFGWNGEDASRGRQVWHSAAETEMKSERHFWATLNYVLHNAVRHGYVERWQDWPFTNASLYLADIGREEAERRWREYPILDYGKGWDPPEL